MKQNNHKPWWVNNDLNNIKLTKEQMSIIIKLKQWYARQNRETQEAEWFQDDHINNNINRIVE